MNYGTSGRETFLCNFPPASAIFLYKCGVVGITLVQSNSDHQIIF